MLQHPAQAAGPLAHRRSEDVEKAVADFCEWSWMRIKLTGTMSVITANHFGPARSSWLKRFKPGEPHKPPPGGRELSLPGNSCELGGNGKKEGTPAASSPVLAAEKRHVVAATKELVGITKHRQYLVGQMVSAMQMVSISRFRYPAPYERFF